MVAPSSSLIFLTVSAESESAGNEWPIYLPSVDLEYSTFRSNELFDGSSGSLDRARRAGCTSQTPFAPLHLASSDHDGQVNGSRGQLGGGRLRQQARMLSISMLPVASQRAACSAASKSCYPHTGSFAKGSVRRYVLRSEGQHVRVFFRSVSIERGLNQRIPTSNRTVHTRRKSNVDVLHRIMFHR